MAIDETLIQTLMNEAKDRDTSLLLAGLTVLAKDAAEFLAATGRAGTDVQLFQQVYSDALSVERDFWERNGSRVFASLQDAGLPRSFAATAVTGLPDLSLSPLGDPAIVHEWTVGPGRDLLRKFAVKFRATICGKDGPYDKLQNGLLGQADLPVTIVSAILSAGLSPATFWYPLAVYVSLLLSKAALKTYCETDDVTGII